MQRPAYWLIALFTGVGLSQCQALTFTLIYEFLLESVSPPSFFFPPVHAVDQNFAFSCTSHSPEHKRRQLVSTTGIVVYKQMCDKQQMCELILLVLSLGSCLKPRRETNTMEKFYRIVLELQQ